MNNREEVTVKVKYKCKRTLLVFEDIAIFILGVEADNLHVLIKTYNRMCFGLHTFITDIKQQTYSNLMLSLRCCTSFG